MNRQKMILAILLLIFCVMLFFSYRAMPTTSTVGSLTFKPGEKGVKRVETATATTPAVDKIDDGTVLDISRLNQKIGYFSGYRRNIFKPIFIKVEPVVFRKAPPVAPPKQVVMPVVKPAVAVASQDVSQPLARFVFLGFLKKGREKTIFLANENKDILLVKAGNTIADRYQATSITEQSLTLTVIDTGDVIVIPLVENQPMMNGL